MGLSTNSGIKAPEFRSLPAGCGSAFEFAIRFHLWWQSQVTDPTWEAIAAEFRVHRSTAYRWRSSYMAALGLPVGEVVQRATNGQYLPLPRAMHPWRKEDREAMARRDGVAA